VEIEIEDRSELRSGLGLNAAQMKAALEDARKAACISLSPLETTGVFLP
jgi:hypothetical protein